MIRIANAPCSWGALEFDLEGDSPSYIKVLTEMKKTGYEGTELGDWGFMPTDPNALRDTVLKYDLQLLGAFVPVALAHSSAHEEGIARALKTAKLMFDAGFQDAFIVLADDNGSVEERTKNAGRISPEMGLSDDLWKTFASGAEMLAKAVKEKYGMRTVFHHHCGGYVETPNEVARLMELTDSSVLGLCLDTGHYAFGGGDPVAALREYYDRIWHVHFKDFDAEIGERSIAMEYDYFKSVEEGVFCELGKGVVDFRSVVSVLEERRYDGWIVVEQDVLPGMGSPMTCALNNRNFIKELGI